MLKLIILLNCYLVLAFGKFKMGFLVKNQMVSSIFGHIIQPYVIFGLKFSLASLKFILLSFGLLWFGLLPFSLILRRPSEFKPFIVLNEVVHTHLPYLQILPFRYSEFWKFLHSMFSAFWEFGFLDNRPFDIRFFSVLLT